MKQSSNLSDAELVKLNNKVLFVRDASPDEWLSYAEELGEAAESLWLRSDDFMTVDAELTKEGSINKLERRTGHARTYILLAGLALENCLKGIIISKDPTLVNKGQLDKSIKSHVLVTLAELCQNLILSVDDRMVLSICQDAIPYWGRYPIPLTYGGLLPKEAATDDFRKKFLDLHFRLCKTLYDAIKDGWDSGLGTQVISVQSSRYGDDIQMDKRFPWVTEGEG